MCVLCQICEDTPVQLESEVPGAPDRPSSVLVPRLLRLFESPHEDAKCLAVSIMNLLAGGMPHAVAANLDRCSHLPHLVSRLTRIPCMQQHTVRGTA